MKYHIFGRFWIGFGVGNIIGSVVTLLISYVYGGGSYLPVMPQLAQFFSREVDAVLVQFLCFGIVGVVFAEAGILFALERLHFGLKCLLHFCITSVFFVPFLCLCYVQWSDAWQWLLILLNLAFTYLIAWLTSYCSNRADVKAINQRIKDRRDRL